MAQVTPLLAGALLGHRYRLGGVLGKGGMGVLLAALDEPTGTQVALKQLLDAGQGGLEGFRREYELLSGLSHPALPRALSWGTEHLPSGPVHYYVRDYVAGETLRRCGGGERAARALRDVLSALDCLHRVGFLHGDVTPDNVLVTPEGRGVLIDLGCARPFGSGATTVSGTPGYLAPELLDGGAFDGRADLYALGLTLRECFAERLPAAWKGLVGSLCAAEPGRRPESARDAAARLGRGASQWEEGLHSPARLVGRTAELAALAQWRRAWSERRDGPRVLSLVGPRGCGNTRLLSVAVAEAQLDGEVLWARAEDPEPVAWLLRQAAGVSLGETPARLALQAAQVLSARREPLLLVLEDLHRLSSAERQLLDALARSLASEGSVGLLTNGSVALEDSAVQRLTLAPLDLEALREWTRGALSDGALRRLHQATGGLPAELVLRLAGDGKARAAGGVLGQSAQLADELGRCGDEGRRLLAELVVALRPVALPAEGVRAAAAAELQLRGWVFREGSGLRLVSERVALGVSAALGERALRDAHRAWLERLLAEEERESSDARLAAALQHALGAGEPEQAVSLLLAARARVQSAPLTFAVALRHLVVSCREAPALVLASRALLEVGEVRAACAGALRAVRRQRRQGAVEERLLAADCELRLARAAEAERLLRPLQRATLPDATRALVQERLARASIQRAHYAEAAEHARAGLRHAGSSDVQSALWEALGVAMTWLGEPVEARALLDLALSHMDARSPRERCRLLGQVAIADYRAGKLREAGDLHAEALALAEAQGFDELVAVSALNCGTVQHSLGEWAGALTSFERGSALARALGRRTTELTLRYNLANLSAELGDYDGAEAKLTALRHALREGDERFALAAQILEAELDLERGQPQRAAELIADGLRMAPSDAVRERLELEILAVQGITAQQTHLEEQRVTELERRVTELGASDLGARLQLSVLPHRARQGDAAAEQRLRQLQEQASSRGEWLLAAKAATERFWLARQRGEASSAALGEQAARYWDRLAAGLSPTLRECFWRHPRRAPLLERPGDLTQTERGASAEVEALRRLLLLSRRVNSTLSLPRVLGHAIEAAVDLCGAERGFALLRDEDGSIRVVAGALEGGAPPSQSIVARAIAHDEVQLTTDASSDPRFQSQGSVHALRLKSVLCVPITTAEGVLGALYLDSRVLRARFTAREQQLLTALADQVAVAMSNARLHGKIAQQLSELEAHKRTIERLVQQRERELAQLRVRVERQEQALASRYDYSKIVGRGASMRGVLERLDRVVGGDTSLLIRGESGTGKELVARAVHYNGPRRDGPFVSVNCAAIPEALLESELFGHLRGAFTGAERDKLGLIPSADGGTLFLDEVGELPLSMQAKLLRVIQEKEVTPLGATQPRKLELRWICATHRDLRAEVEARRFREDLYYRLAVIEVLLPPLRERLEDLPELCEGILSRLAREAGREAPSLSQAALRRLKLHPWPGNVRELQNVLTRAFVLGESSRIEAAQLDFGQHPARAKSSASRRQFEEEERSRLLEALRAQRWNVSAVARSFGIPRNTLYRKLARWGVSPQREQGSARAPKLAPEPG